MMDKEILNDKIEKRTEEMLASGWIDEVKLLVHKQAESGKPYPALDSIGYREIQAFLNDEMSVDEMKEEIIIKTRQYSRRQVQWFRKEKIDAMIDGMNELSKSVLEVSDSVVPIANMNAISALLAENIEKMIDEGNNKIITSLK